MGFSSHSLHQICQEILGNKGDADVRSNSEIECGESNPKVCESFIFDCLCHGVKDIFIWECSISILFHFLNLGFGIIEGQA